MTEYQNQVSLTLLRYPPLSFLCPEPTQSSLADKSDLTFSPSLLLVFNHWQALVGPVPEFLQDISPPQITGFSQSPVPTRLLGPALASRTIAQARLTPGSPACLGRKFGPL